MTALCDATILLSIGLATVLGAVFAVATTFLGRSLQQAREAEEQEERNARAQVEATINKITQTMQAERSQDVLATLR